jgi:DNA-binding GntR family transcriptional regulator
MKTPVKRPIERPTGRPKGSGMLNVYRHLREGILNLSLPPGSTLDEIGLVKEFGVSRTPLREALIKLASEQLVEIIPNRGARVVSLDFFEIGEVFEALTLAQRFTTRMAALRHAPADLTKLKELSRLYESEALQLNFQKMSEANRDFHSLIGRMSRNRFVADSLDRILDRTLRLANVSLANASQTDESYRDYFKHVVAEHDLMIELIGARRLDEVDDLAVRHAKLFHARVIDFIEVNNAGDLRFE